MCDDAARRFLLREISESAATVGGGRGHHSAQEHVHDAAGHSAGNAGDAGVVCGTFSSLEADRGVFWSSVAVHGSGAGAAGHGDHRARVLRSGGRGAAVHLHTNTDLLFLTGVFISC